MANYTPGPWEVYEPRFNGHPYEVRQVGGEFVAQIFDRSGKRMEDRHANAKLIAAAPEMFEFLSRLSADPAAVSAAELWALIKKVEG